MRGSGVGCIASIIVLRMIYIGNAGCGDRNSSEVHAHKVLQKFKVSYVDAKACVS